MAAITIPGENLIAQKQANNELLSIDQFVLANIPNLDPENPVDREEQLPPQSQIVLQEQVSQMGYISPNLVVYSLMLDTGGKRFDFNWIGLYSSADDVVVSIAYLPTQTKDPSVAMTRNFMLEFSGAAETTDINVDAKSWQVDFSARMDGTDERVRQLSEDTIGRQLFYGDACKVSAGENGYYKVASGTGHVAGIRFNYVEKSVLVTKFPSSIWMDVWQRKNSMSDIQPEAVAVVSQTDRVDYTDGDGVKHYLEKVAEVENNRKIIDFRKLNKFISISKSDFHIPLISDINIREGFGLSLFERVSGGCEQSKLGFLSWKNNDEPRFEKDGLLIEGSATNINTGSQDINSWGVSSSLEKTVSNIPFIAGDNFISVKRLDSKMSYISTGKVSLDKGEHELIISIYVHKSSTQNLVAFRTGGSGVSTKTITYDIINNDIGGTASIKKVEDLGEIWKISYKDTITATSDTLMYNLLFFSSKDSQQGIVICCGCQISKIESSYIVTKSTPVTRFKDAIIINDNLPKLYGDLSIFFIISNIRSIGFGTIIKNEGHESINKYLLIAYNGNTKRMHIHIYGNNLSDMGDIIPEGSSVKLAITVKNKREVTLYLNGLKSETRLISMNGKLKSENTEIGGGSFFGNIKDVNFWNKCLEPEEVSSL